MADDEVNKLIEKYSKITLADGKEKYAQALLDLGCIYEEFKHDYAQAETCYLKISRDESPEIYSAAQFNLANLYQNQIAKPDYDKAEACYLNITKEDPFNIYTMAQFNLGFLYKNIRREYDKAEKCYANISKNDSHELYFHAQFNLGEIHQLKKNYDKAKAYYLNITQKDSPDLYAKAQINLGSLYSDSKQNFMLAKDCYLNVTKKEFPEFYPFAQYNLGRFYSEKEHNYEKAKACYLNIINEKSSNDYPRTQSLCLLHLDNKKSAISTESCLLSTNNQRYSDVYPRALLNLGSLYTNNKFDYDKAEACYLKITKKEYPEFYSAAQFNLANIYQNQITKPDYDKAEACYLNITKEDSPNIYTMAQFNLGFLYKNIRKEYDKAEKCYSNIYKNDSHELYFHAQFNLGEIHQFKKNSDKAKAYYLNITKKDSPDLYAKAQINLGSLYSDSKQNFMLAKDCYLNVTKKEFPEYYPFAQFNLGRFYCEKEHNYEEAEACYLNIINKKPSNVYPRHQSLGSLHSDNKNSAISTKSCLLSSNSVNYSDVYPQALLNLGSLYTNIKHDYDKAEHCYLDIHKDDNLQFYYKAQFELAYIYFFRKNSLEQSEIHFHNVSYSCSEQYYYIAAKLILELIKYQSSFIHNKKQLEKQLSKIKKICELVNEIKNTLFVSFIDSYLFDSKNPERRVAHYTKPSVLFNLLKGKKPSKFRLNIVDFMNDPSENQVLNSWLNITNDPDNGIKSFLASFSFNHNSLNQFRLYGNESNIVGSGVSIAFNQNFFGLDQERSINPAVGSTAIAKSINLTNSFNEKQIEINIEETTKKNDSSLHPLPLYRCLYFDPKTGYMALAKRNKQSFYLEKHNEQANNIDKAWNNYIKSLQENKKITNIRYNIKKIKNYIDDLLNITEFREIPYLTDLLSLAVLPISCLIKHAAFEDEDECRMIYITHIGDKKIVEPQDYQTTNNLFIEYINIESYIDNIYLGPQCGIHHKLWLQNHIKKDSCKKQIKLIKSEMPLR